MLQNTASEFLKENSKAWPHPFTKPFDFCHSPAMIDSFRGTHNLFILAEQA